MATFQLRRTRAAWRLAAGGAGMATAAAGLLVFACVFLAVAGPRASAGLRTRALQQSLNTGTPLQRTMSVALDETSLDSRMGTATTSLATFTSAQAGFRRALTSVHVPLAASTAGDWSGLDTALTPLTRYPAAAAPSGIVPPKLKLVYRTQLGRSMRLVSGALPATASQGADGTTLQIAVAQATATAFGLRTGSRLGDGPGLTLVVSGIIRPVAQTSSLFWTADPLMATPLLIDGNYPYWEGAAFIGTGELAAFQQTFDPVAVNAMLDFPLDLRGVTAADAQALSDEFAAASLAAGYVGSTGSYHSAGTVVPVITTGLTSILARFIPQNAAADSVLSLLSVSLAAVGIVVIVAATQLVVEQRRNEFALRRARGGARWQIGLCALAGAAVAVPAAAAAIVLAVVVTAGYSASLAWWLAACTVLAALASAPLIAMRAHRDEQGQSLLPGTVRQARPARRLVLRRVSLEVLLIALAVSGLVLLRQESAAAGGWFTSLAPVLVAVPAAIVVVRCYPLLTGALLRFARGRPGVTAFVGFSRAMHNTRRVTLPVFTLVLALGVVAFGVMIRGSVSSGEVAASWGQTGADAVVNVGTGLRSVTPAAERAIASVPGVTHIAPVAALYDSAHGDAFTVVAVDPAQYGALIAATPGGSFAVTALSGSVRGVIPALASPGYASLLGGTSGVLNTPVGPLTIRVTGPVSGVPGVAGNGVLLVMPASALPVPVAPQEVLVTGPRLDGAALRQVVARDLPGATVTLRSAVLTGLTSAPLAHSTYLAITAGSAAAALLMVLMLAITLVLTARDGAPILARLRVMGLGRRQARWLETVQMLPQVTVAAAGGVACACALAPLIGPSIDLSAFTGAGSAVPVQGHIIPLLAAAAGLLLLAVLTVAVQHALTPARAAPD
jgi:putative ABC transport system permease protein